ncbi:chemocyanin-like [Tripterygium wilfordii]|uniref:Chemocyanin-like n=1 Tax=Tripterygium wilfordii TaxID=458696 RepID=A0A7J7C5J2_TRIWF|nr:cucumber peeling cupredoxin-like [Tripterygium wilfordii]KAF5729388.1 chemocyanin-like [Tripterygium wilfordii]
MGVLGCLSISPTVLVFGLLGSILETTSFGMQYTVGDSVWSIPPYPDYYTKWSSSNVFLVGDSLYFDFVSDFYDVVQVSSLDYENCTTMNSYNVFNAGPAIVPLVGKGVFYYICNISNYCDLGQKVSVTVSEHYKDQSPSPSPSSHSLVPPLVPVVAPEPSHGGRNWSIISPSPGTPGIPIEAPNGHRRNLGVVTTREVLFGLESTLFLVFILFVLV